MPVYVDQSYQSFVAKGMPCIVPGSLAVICELHRRKTTKEKMLLIVTIDIKVVYSKPLEVQDQDPQSYFQGSASTQSTLVVSVLKNCSLRLALAEAHGWENIGKQNTTRKNNR